MMPTIFLIKHKYKHNVNCVISNYGECVMFMTNGGLRQGGGLSSTLFIVYRPMDENNKICSERSKKFKF